VWLVFFIGWRDYATLSRTKRGRERVGEIFERDMEANTLLYTEQYRGHYSFALICVFSCNATTVCEKNSLSFTYNFVKGRFYVSFHVVSYSLSECLWNQIGEGKKDRIKLIYYIICEYVTNNINRSRLHMH